MNVCISFFLPNGLIYLFRKFTINFKLNAKEFRQGETQLEHQRQLLAHTHMQQSFSVFFLCMC